MILVVELNSPSIYFREGSILFVPSSSSTTVSASSSPNHPTNSLISTLNLELDAGDFDERAKLPLAQNRAANESVRLKTWAAIALASMKDSMTLS